MKYLNKKTFFLLLFYLIPLILDDSTFTDEIIWLVYIFPSIFIPFQFGKKGGMIAALTGTIFHLGHEYIEIFIEHEVYSTYNIWCMGIITIINVSVALMIGILAEEVKREQNSLQKVFSKMEYMAYHDNLTGLPNRWNFEIQIKTALEEARKNNTILATLCIDLDRFKLINESLGHSFGDQLLKSVANRISGIVNEGDFIARQGGDEFILFLVGVSSKKQVEERILAILKATRKPFTINNQEYFMTCSIGASFYPIDGTTSEELIQHADIAMYSAKELGGNRYQFYNKEKLQEINDVVKIEALLRRAILQKEFTLHYQPLIDLQLGKIIGMEALIRWECKELGTVSPADFIPLAEEIGLISQLGKWVLREACMQTKNLSDSTQFPIKVAVNISSTQFKDTNFVDIVKSVLEETSLSPNQLELEITESVSLEQIEEVIDKLEIIKKMGITIAIDDFGTGYSSISYLRDLPVDTLKIDQSFIRNMMNNRKDRALVQSVISLSKTFGFNITAEGVETKDQLDLLQSFNCGQAQGYLFSKPVPIYDFYHILKSFQKSSGQLNEIAIN